MLIIALLQLPTNIPVVGREITPFIRLRRLSTGALFTGDVPESAPIDGYFMAYRWCRLESEPKVLESEPKVPVCCVHPTQPATIQCLGCLKANIPVAKSYRCSTKCFQDTWVDHRILHEQAAINVAKKAESPGSSRVTNAGLTASASNIAQKPGQNSHFFSCAPASERVEGETWFEVGHNRTYIPTADDIGHVLRFECVAIDVRKREPFGLSKKITTSHVIPAPPIPRQTIQINGVDVPRRLDSVGRIASFGTFRVLSYNILSDAASNMYSYCPYWAISWPYRRQNLLKEIVSYHADILCLQEVQSNHFEEYLSPELEKHGYEALYKKQTSENYAVNPHFVDGCAILFRKDRFSNLRKYEVEYNKYARSLIDAMIADDQKKTALDRLIKDNVALIVVLEAKFTDHPKKRQLLCVANTHLNVHQDLKDVKLWQVHKLLKGLEKIAASGDISMLVCGDFNSVPGSAPHSLLASGKVEQVHPDLAIDPLNIFKPASKITHKLPLVSAYSSFAKIGLGHSLEQQRRRMDVLTNEPLFTTYTRDFTGTVDYIFYTEDSLTVESLLELLDAESLSKNTALPSPEWSSDHIALLAEFRCKSRSNR